MGGGKVRGLARSWTTVYSIPRGYGVPVLAVGIGVSPGIYATVPGYHGGYHPVPYMVLPLLLVLYGLWVSYMYTPVSGPLTPHTPGATPHPTGPLQIP